MPRKAVPNQVLAILKSGQVKAEEVKWSGIEEWLKEQKGRVNKEDVLAFLDANEVHIQKIAKNDTCGFKITISHLPDTRR